MAIVAAAMVGAALYYYPWPVSQIQNAKVNEDLIEEYALGNISEVEIEQFDYDTGTTRKLQLFKDRNSKQWVMPQYADFPAGNNLNISAITMCLNGLTVYSLTSEDANDQIRYGVLEPDASAASGKGIKLTLTDSQDSQVAALIVGQSPEGQEEKRFVRIPGESQIYVVDFPAQILSTEFTSWVNTNLMGLNRQQNQPVLDQLRYIEIDKYVLDPNTLMNAESPKEYLYKARLALDSNGWKASVWRPNAEGDLPEKPSSRGENIQPNWFGLFDFRLTNTTFAGVKKKQDIVVKQIIEPTESAKPIEFSSMLNNGFKYTNFENGRHQFDGVGGEVRICRNNGVVQTLLFGRFDDNQSTGDQLQRFGVLLASVDESVFPIPEKIEDANADQEREYQANLKRRENLVSAAQQTATAFNQIHAEWYYVIPEADFNALSPSLKDLTGAN